jgi:hypothetical protein
MTRGFMSAIKSDERVVNRLDEGIRGRERGVSVIAITNSSQRQRLVFASVMRAATGCVGMPARWQ